MTQHPNLPAALAAFQTELPRIEKGNTANVASSKGSYSYSYADLADISPVVIPLLAKHGLSWMTMPTITETGFVLAYKLMHESGESIEGAYPLPAQQTPAQQLGSAITYARRYALCAVTGVAPGGDDDDAAGAPSAPQRQQRQQAPAAPQPVAPPDDWRALIADAANLDALRALHSAANEQRWMTAEIAQIFRARKDEMQWEIDEAARFERERAEAAAS